MLSIEELIRQSTAIKQSSDQLITMTTAAGQNLSQASQRIAQMTQGSRTGMEGARALSQAVKSLGQTVTVMKEVSRNTDQCIANLKR